jgi:hypothetical protein
LSKQAMMAVLDRAAKDQRFNWQMMKQPDGALAQFDLTEPEREALRNGDRDELVACGLDERIAAWIPWRTSRPSP